MVVASVAVGVVYPVAGVDLCVYGDGVLLLLLSGLSERSIWMHEDSQKTKTLSRDYGDPHISRRHSQDDENLLNATKTR